MYPVAYVLFCVCFCVSVVCFYLFSLLFVLFFVCVCVCVSFHAFEIGKKNPMLDLKSAFRV